MRKRTGIRAYFDIYLQKNVPIQAGLGGGSGNAATAMFGFNALTGCKADNEELKVWSAEIGSDITFFFSSGIPYILYIYEEMPLFWRFSALFYL